MFFETILIFIKNTQNMGQVLAKMFLFHKMLKFLKTKSGFAEHSESEMVLC